MSSGKMQSGAMVLACLQTMLVLPNAQAAIQPRSILKTYFETGDVPTQDQFSNLIDSYIHRTDDGLTLTAFGTNAARDGFMRLGTGVGINETMPDTQLGLWTKAPVPNVPPIPGMCPSFCGAFGFLPLQYADSAGQAHYGFLQISMEADTANASGGLGTAPPGSAIFVEHWVWESSPNTTLTTFIVPEPGSATLCLFAMLPMLRRTAR